MGCRVLCGFGTCDCSREHSCGLGGAALLPCPKRKPQAEEKLHLFGRLIWMRWVKRKDQVGRILKSEEEEEIVPLSK
jgi:hypothetical protein